MPNAAIAHYVHEEKFFAILVFVDMHHTSVQNWHRWIGMPFVVNYYVPRKERANVSYCSSVRNILDSSSIFLCQ